MLFWTAQKCCQATLVTENGMTTHHQSAHPLSGVALGNQGTHSTLREELAKKRCLERHSSPPSDAPSKNTSTDYTCDSCGGRSKKKSRSPLTLKIHPSSSSDFSFPRKISLSVPFPSLSHLSLGSHPGARQTPSQSAELPMGHKGFHCRAIGPRTHLQPILC